MSKGYIYIMTNPCLQDMVKIGYATNVEERRKQLSTTALPYEYEVYAAYETQGKLEDKKLHNKKIKPPYFRAVSFIENTILCNTVRLQRANVQDYMITL